MTEDKKKELQSAAFERLLHHLDERKDVQNIDLMNLAGFCRNCISRWYREEAEKKNITISVFCIFKWLLPINSIPRPCNYRCFNWKNVSSWTFLWN